MTFTGRGLYASSSKEPGRRHFGWLLIGACVAVAALVIGGLTAVGGISTNQTVREDSVDGAGEVAVNNQTSGNVEITGTGEDTVSIERTVRETMVSSVSEEVTTDSGTVQADARCDGAVFFGGCRVDYRVAVPEGTAVTVDGGSGDVNIESVDGDGAVNVSVNSGDVRADDVGGDVTVSTTSGGVRLDGIGGNMDLEATSGSIWASGSGEKIHATATSGSVELHPSSVTDVEASATSGSVIVDGAFQTLDAEATSGSVDVDATEPFQRISAEATSGALSMRVPDTAYAVTADVNSGARDIEVTRDDAADAQIDASTTSGSIDIAPVG